MSMRKPCPKLPMSDPAASFSRTMANNPSLPGLVKPTMGAPTMPAFEKTPVSCEPETAVSLPLHAVLKVGYQEKMARMQQTPEQPIACGAPTLTNHHHHDDDDDVYDKHVAASKYRERDHHDKDMESLVERFERARTQPSRRDESPSKRRGAYHERDDIGCYAPVSAAAPPLVNEDDYQFSSEEDIDNLYHLDYSLLIGAGNEVTSMVVGPAEDPLRTEAIAQGHDAMEHAAQKEVANDAAKALMNHATEAASQGHSQADEMHDGISAGVHSEAAMSTNDQERALNAATNSDEGTKRRAISEQMTSSHANASNEVRTVNDPNHAVQMHAIINATASSAENHMMVQKSHDHHGTANAKELMQSSLRTIDMLIPDLKDYDRKVSDVHEAYLRLRRSLIDSSKNMSNLLPSMTNAQAHEFVSACSRALKHSSNEALNENQGMPQSRMSAVHRTYSSAMAKSASKLSQSLAMGFGHLKSGFKGLRRSFSRSEIESSHKYPNPIMASSIAALINDGKDTIGRIRRDVDGLASHASDGKALLYKASGNVLKASTSASLNMLRRYDVREYQQWLRQHNLTEQPTHEGHDMELHTVHQAQVQRHTASDGAA